jgi:hypothetical protein
VTASVTHRLTKGFTGQVSYTYSHATDDVSNGGVLPFNLSETGGSQLGQLAPQGLSENYSNADYDVRHNLTASYIWDIPFKSSSRVVNEIVGGWSISGTVFSRSGYPFSVLDGLPPLIFTNALNATETVAQFAGVGPTSCGKPKISGGQPVACLDATTQFPIDFNLTNTGFATTRRNSFRGPHYFNSDLDLLKRFKVTERVDFAVGANFYNVFNHPNFQIPNNDVNNVFSAPFGTVTSTAEGPTSIYGAFAGSAVSGRVVQLHARIEF